MFRYPPPPNFYQSHQANHPHRRQPMKPIITLSAILGLAFSSIAYAQEPIVIKFSHVAAIDTPKGQAAEYFKQQVEKRTKNRVKVEIFANSTLYKDKEEL